MPKDPAPPPPDSFLSSLGNAVSLQQPEVKQYPWPVALLLTLAAVVFGAVVWARMVFVSQRAAKLASELRKTKESQKQAHENACLEANAKKRAKLALESKRLKLRVELLEQKIAARLKQREKYSEELKKVATWDDLVVNDKRGQDD
jgi:hypothetical protein